jgi:UDP-glucose 4-epimerase
LSARNEELRDRNVLVTGGAGFVGSNLVDGLRRAGARVTVIDNLMTGRREHLEEDPELPPARLVVADVRDAAAVRAAVEGQEIVFHLAANADVPNSVRDPEYDFTTNVVGGHNVIRACVTAKVGRLLYASTAAVYGNPDYVPIDEAHPLRPVSPYGASKLSVEHLALATHKVFGLPVSVVRIFNIFGPRQAHYVMYDFLRKLLENPDELAILGDGQQQRDFCYVGDACRLLMTAASSPATIGEVINLAGGSPLTVEQLGVLMIERLGLTGRTRIRFTGSSWDGDIKALLGSPAKARRILGWVPEVTRAEGIDRLIGWLERHRGWQLSSVRER